MRGGGGGKWTPHVCLTVFSTGEHSCYNIINSVALTFKGPKTNRLLEIAWLGNGFVSSSEATKHNIQRRELTRAVAEGTLLKLERGLYCLPETWEDEYVIAQHRFSRGVFSHDTALYLLGLSDQAPEALTMSFPRGYNPSAAKRVGLVAKSSPEGLHDLGVSPIKTPYGNTVHAYCAERSLCDMLRGCAYPDAQAFNPAIRAYLSSSGKSVPTLLDYASRLGVANKVRRYLEVLL